MTRTPLPQRRQNETANVSFEGRAFTVTIGFDAYGRAREIFSDGHRHGSEMQRLVEDACTMISVALQHGVPREALMKSLGRIPAFHGGRQSEGPASVLGAIMEAVTDRPELAGVA